MKVNLHHPDKKSLQALHNLEEDQVARRSPHVGNVVSPELACLLGAAKLGIPLKIELVDTITGLDSYSNPRVISTMDGDTPLTSKNHAKNRIVGACIPTDGADETTIADIHIEALLEVLPDHVTLERSSEYFASLGSEVLDILLGVSSVIVPRPQRTVLEDGKIATLDNATTEIFGVNGSRTGRLLPLEAMMASELLESAMENPGLDSQVVHIAGPDMIRYTQDQDLMKVVSSIAVCAAAELGLPFGTSVTYSIPCMATILDDTSFPVLIPEGTVSQHDLVKERKHE